MTLKQYFYWHYSGVLRGSKGSTCSILPSLVGSLKDILNSNKHRHWGYLLGLNCVPRSVIKLYLHHLILLNLSGVFTRLGVVVFHVL